MTNKYSKRLNELAGTAQDLKEAKDFDFDALDMNDQFDLAGEVAAIIEPIYAKASKMIAAGLQKAEKQITKKYSVEVFDLWVSMNEQSAEEDGAEMMSGSWH